MATYEHAALMQHKDQNGDMHLLYPITKAENVDGLYGDAALTGVPTAPTAAPGTNTTQVATTAFVQQELEDVKKSVSDGKTAVANAITAKGVTTATDATFDTMAANISAIESGSGIGLNVFTQETEPETKEGIWVKTANPHQSVVVGNEIYSNPEIENPEWVSSVELPAKFSGLAVVYGNKIHILGTEYRSGGSTAYTGHYAFDGVSWSENSNVPYACPAGAAVVYDNKIHILGGYNNTGHYAFDGVSWSEVSTLPYKSNRSCAVVYDNKIHLLGSSDTAYRTKHYAFDGVSWSEVSTLPYNLLDGFAVVYDNKIHLLGGQYNSSCETKHYAFDGVSWSEVSTLPISFYFGGAVVYDNKIHLLGSSDTAYRTKHYAFDGVSWSEVSTLPYDNPGKYAVVYDNKIHLLGHGYSGDKTKHYTLALLPEEYIGSKIAVYQNPSNTSGTYATNFISGVPITGENNKFPSGFDDVYYIDDSGNVEESPTYYGDGTQWIKFKN